VEWLKEEMGILLRIEKRMHRGRTKNGVRYYPKYRIYVPSKVVKRYGLKEGDLVKIIPLIRSNQSKNLIQMDKDSFEGDSKTTQVIHITEEKIQEIRRSARVSEVVAKAEKYKSEKWSLIIGKIRGHRYLYAHKGICLGLLSGELEDELRRRGILTKRV